MNLKKQQELFDVFVSKMEETLLKKGEDYANTDVLSNFKLAGNIINLSKEQQCLSLISMKVARLGNLLFSGNTPNNESIADNLLDLANYTFLLHCLIEDK